MAFLLTNKPGLFVLLCIACIGLYIYGAPLLSLIFIGLFGVFAISELVELFKNRKIDGD